MEHEVQVWPATVRSGEGLQERDQRQMLSRTLWRAVGFAAMAATPSPRSSYVQLRLHLDFATRDLLGVEAFDGWCAPLRLEDTRSLTESVRDLAEQYEEWSSEYDSERLADRVLVAYHFHQDSLDMTIGPIPDDGRTWPRRRPSR